METQRLPSHVLDESNRVSFRNRDGEIEQLEPCGGSGTCARCNGNGEHLRLTHHYVECEVCDGYGECPCTYNMYAHEKPVA